MVTTSSCFRDEPVSEMLVTPDQPLRHLWPIVSGGRFMAIRSACNRLLQRLERCAREWQEASRLLQRAAERGKRISPAGKWLLDNCHLIHEHIAIARRQLPQGDGKTLPLLSAGPYQGLPRIYALAAEFISHSHGRLDRTRLYQFFREHQSSASLTLAELWATANMLRLALVEKLCSLAPRTIRGGEHAAAPAGADEQNQSPDTRSIRNSILSLRALGFLDWRKFVDVESAVERVLREDPAGVYGRMDCASRDQYRRIVERLAKRSPLTELEVAQKTVACARNSCPASAAEQQPPVGSEVRRCHVGYYLVDEGLATLEQDVAYRRCWHDVVTGLAVRSPLGCYLGGVVVVWLLTFAAAIAWPMQLGWINGSWSSLILLALLAGVASQSAVSIVNWLCMLIVPAKWTMKLDFSRGIPADCRTLVAIPSLLSSEQGIRELVDELEQRYLANQDANLVFALLTDFPDANQEVLPSDRRLLMFARSEIQRLNAQYCRNRSTIFFLLHRPRQWNEQEHVWMAEERKRGKLAALDRLIQAGDSRAFSLAVGDLAELSAVRYVITLDSDTRLPRDSARKLVGCMAHPLNWPQIDPQTRQVVKGHGVLQPRVGVPISEANHSLFSRMLAGDPGIDPYTRQTSDTYHDVFGQGSFIGKGIYDVYAFSTALEGRFPENRILSHDLIEGCYARSGLVNDVELFEGLPLRFLADMSRRHRWIRGDWQIASWLWKQVPAARGAANNTLDWLSRWKLFDNLRRSLVPPFLLGFLLVGWTLVPQLAAYWTALGLLLAGGPSLAACLPGFVCKPQEKPWSLHLKDQGVRSLKMLSVEAFSLCVLPYTAQRHVDAVARTLYRLCVSHRRLLEWTTASDAESRCPRSCRDHYRAMWACMATAAVVTVVLGIVDPRALPRAGPMLLAWLAGPLLAWWISQPSQSPRKSLRTIPERQVRRWARQTWHYFETFMNEREHWLPPDNVQEHSRAKIATRTSPTNIGMGLLSGLAAYDLGYLPGTALIDRTRSALHTLQQLERYRGHFYNWYNSRTLQPVEPRYVSSVDSGNLWGALVVLAVGLDELGDRPVAPPRFLEGLQDSLAVIAALRSAALFTTFDDPFDACLAQLYRQCAGPSPRSARRAHEVLCRIRALAATLVTTTPANRPALRQWTETFLRQSAVVHQELLQWAFWLRMPRRTPKRETVLGQACEKLRAEFDRLDATCTLGALPETAGQVADYISWLLANNHEDGNHAGDAREPASKVLSAVHQAAEQAALAASEQRAQVAELTGLCRNLCKMDFRFLFHPQRKLLSIGFQVHEHRCDNSYYDLLASEARLTSFLAVCHGQLPPEHWSALGRMMTLADGKPVLLSWSGSMFEYLMPGLLMPSYPGTLLDASCRAAVRRQIRYARRHGVPWGVSESCYNSMDERQTYQYRAHGVPGLGLKRGLGKHLVVAPYASALAMMIAPQEASHNLAWLEEQGYLSPHGFYDAIDFTPQDPSATIRPVPCRAVMAHHSGMTLLALENVLLGEPMPRRFLKVPACAAHDLLLQERMPQAIRPSTPETRDDNRLSRRIAALRGWLAPLGDNPPAMGPDGHSPGRTAPRGTGGNSLW